MPLRSGDIRFARSANMSDVAEGGGPPSAQLLNSGRSNEIFPDISEETRTVGRVEIYQIFSVLRNSDSTPLLGGNVILAEPPADPKVSITLLTLKNPFATRADIVQRMESGMSPGPEWSGYPLENHYQTMRSLAVLQRPGMSPPTIGRTYILSYNEGASGARSQRIRIKKTDTQVRVFTEIVNGQLIEFQAQVTTCELFDGLQHDYPGSPPSRFFARQANKTLVRETVYSDSGMFCGASRLVAPCQPNDVWLQLASIYTQVVPNNRTEAAVVDQRPSARQTIVLAEVPRRVEVGITPHTQRIKISEENAGTMFVVQLRPLPEQGSVFIDYWSLGQRYTMQADPDGRITGAGGGAVSSLTGAMSFSLNALPDIGSSICITHGERVGFSNRVGQGAAVRQAEWCWQLEEPGAVPGLLRMTWYSANVLRTAVDDGSGKITGDGAGVLDYPSSTVLLRTAYLPDPGGEIHIEYTVDEVHTELFPPGSVSTPDAGGFVNLALAQQPAAKSLSLEWATARLVSNTSGGNQTTVNAIKDTVAAFSTKFVPSPRHGPASLSGTSGMSVTPWDGGSTGGAYEKTLVSLTTNGTSATLSQESAKTDDDRIVVINTATDDGVGSFINGLGTVNYAGKAVRIKVVKFDRTTEAYQSDFENAKEFEKTITEGGGSSSIDSKKGGEYGTASVGEELFAGSSVVARYRVAPGAPQAKTMTFKPPAIVLDLCPYTSDAVVPGSLQFAWMGETYTDFEGKIYRGRSDVSAGFEAGTLDYASGLALMTDYVVGPGAFVLQSLWTRRAHWTTASLFFSTDVAPLRPGAGGFVLTVLDTKGATLTANVDGQGRITGLHMRGHVEFSRGGVELQFGDFVLDAELTEEEKAQWWYSSADVGAVEANKIWRPWPVDPTTVRYSAVSYIYLPVDVSLMGLDPAALPGDGRAAFVRPADTCTVGITHGGVEFVPALGMTYNLGHERLSFVQVLGPDKSEIHTGYVTDLDAGTVTFTDLTDYPPSVSVVGRTEVYRQIAEVRIDGKVRLTQPVGYGFPAGAVFSTAVRQGDRFARVRRVYDQHSWDGTTWSDGLDLVAGPATGTYNASGHPIEVGNLGAITERWALRIGAGGTTFSLIGQHLGQIASGNINEDFAPTNAAAGAPYFTLRAAGWGSGWVAGNVLFIDTVGAEFQIACVRCTQPGAPAGTSDSAWLVQRGDVGALPESNF